MAGIRRAKTPITESIDTIVERTKYHLEKANARPHKLPLDKRLEFYLEIQGELCSPVPYLLRLAIELSKQPEKNMESFLNEKLKAVQKEKKLKTKQEAKQALLDDIRETENNISRFGAKLGRFGEKLSLEQDEQKKELEYYAWHVAGSSAQNLQAQLSYLRDILQKK